ncbi:unnamed protein product [Paramecium octaurelia]|uniref:Uncharacterized protein n=1 Tax=Paramecium octaurelia TaxID=43137 RepID=A0A8S1TPT4_PAROT|nr:unnamed protein product [Paramecium octaurelia]
MNSEQFNPQSYELQKLYQIRETLHQQQRLQQLNALLQQQRMQMMNSPTQQQPSGLIKQIDQTFETNTTNSSKLTSSKNAFLFAQRLKNKDSIQELTKMVRICPLNTEQTQELTSLITEKLLLKQQKIDYAQQHNLIILHLQITNKLSIDVLQFYVFLFVRFPNLLTIVGIIESWLSNSDNAVAYLEEVCSHFIKEISGTLVQFVCNKDNKSYYKGRLEMLRLLIKYIGNEELLSAFIMLDVTEMLENCIEHQFYKDTFKVIVTFFENPNFSHYKSIEKAIKKLYEKLTPEYKLQLDTLIKEYKRTCDKNKEKTLQNQKSDEI